MPSTTALHLQSKYFPMEVSLNSFCHGLHRKKGFKHLLSPKVPAYFDSWIQSDKSLITSRIEGFK